MFAVVVLLHTKGSKMLKTYVVGGPTELIKRDLAPKLTSLGLDVIGHLDYEKARSGGVKKSLPSSTQVIVILRDMINHSCCTNYVKEAKRRGIYHLLLPRKTSFWPKVIEQLIPMSERILPTSESDGGRHSDSRCKSHSRIRPTLALPVTAPSTTTMEDWANALKNIQELLTIAKTVKEIAIAIEVVASDFNIPNDELKRRWKEVANKSVTSIRAVAKLPDVNSKVLADLFGIPIPTAAAYLAHASREKKKVVTTTIKQQEKKSDGHYRPTVDCQPSLAPVLNENGTSRSHLVGGVETLTITGKLKDIQHLRNTLLMLQESGNISRNLVIVR